ncbi:E3 ubiquitin-protein ligase NRDP1 [Lingula anatina]|uniref:E3 ubiquitin-protein ligase NRDP1 n=1 Tax=Lingula anatina TaxID=7574 RepID=A0A1S3IDA0_LINAN|nr:E3 ubiquitin-protein ligase NRDP1 [Lingula anatina]XP_013395838.1 E3 ubiquitin-protein ligase NRDP1 [Lingula anatina]|eukprot:XP_013395836.1 E3 ubiquitin-protein ligase NRDP1 [Lingula anatina]
MEEQLTCLICYEIADNAVETSCCHHIFCENCLSSVGSNNCPNCRKHFQSVVAHFARRVIGNMQSQCPMGCGLTVSRSEMNEHIARCPRRMLECPSTSCKFSGPRDDFIHHIGDVHRDILLAKAERLFEPEPKGATNIQQGQVCRVERSRNRRNHEARLGSTGKYYCSQRLNGHCRCCNGYCGPTNGCNCEACMKLDVEGRCLPRGWLVNSDGAAARVGPETGHFYCGRRVLVGVRGCDGYCGPTNGPSCEACKKLDTQARDRYSSVWM